MKEKENQLKALIEELGKIRGRHTELVTVYVPAGFSLNKVAEQVRSEQGTASNIKSKQVRKNVIGALERILQHLKLYKETPENGLAIFSGNVSDKEGVTDLEIWAVEPHEPIKTRLYWCGQNFIMDPLKEMVREREIYGIIVLDKSDATIGLLRGKKIEKLKDMDSLVPGKTKAGGWCVHEDTLLHLADGGIRRVRDVGGKGFLCYDFSRMSVTKARHNHYFERASKEGLEIATMYPSFSIKTTPEHKFFVAGSNGFEEKKAGDLKTSDRLILVKKINTTERKIKSSVYVPKRAFVKESGALLLTKRRKGLGLLQKEVAKRLGLSQTVISKLELGKRQLRRENIKRLLDIYGLDSRAFFKNYVIETDEIAFPYYLNESLAQFLGYIMGDGNAERQRIAVSEGDHKLILYYKKLTEELFHVSTSLRERKGKGYWQLRINSCPLLKIVQRHFPGVLDTKERVLPNSFCMAGGKVLAGFLRGLYDAEGFVVTSNNSLGITMNSKSVIIEVQQLLLRFGVIASFREICSKGSYAKKPRYSLVVTDYESLANFRKGIGFSSERKSRLLDIISKKSRISRTDQIPVNGSFIRDLVGRIGMNTSDFPGIGPMFFSDKRNMSYFVFAKRVIPAVDKRVKELRTRQNNAGKLRKLLRVPYHEISRELGVTKSTIFSNMKFGYNLHKIRNFLKQRQKELVKEAVSIRKYLNNVRDSDLISSEIRSIRKLPETGLYYDMEIPRFGNFIANGFVLHNSQARYARVREGLLNDFLKKVGDIASSKFLEVRDLLGVIIAGPGPIKEQFSEGGYLNYQVKAKVLGIVNTSYTGEAGLHEAVERAEDLLSEASIIKEQRVLDRFFDELGKDTGLAVYGFREVTDALKAGNLETLILSEEFDWVEAGLECPECGFKAKKPLARKQLGDQRCPQCNAAMSVESERLLTEDVIKLAEQMSTSVEIVSTSTGRGEQVKELGGIVGITRFRPSP